MADTIGCLKVNPTLNGVVKLTGALDLYRVRAGDYRAIYNIQHKILLILAVRIAHRRKVYR
ncbi:MAG: type II toxin-antitoxin system RelE/ParE family toxin [Acidobacteriota bacterium]